MGESRKFAQGRWRFERGIFFLANLAWFGYSWDEETVDESKKMGWKSIPTTNLLWILTHNGLLSLSNLTAFSADSSERSSAVLSAWVSNSWPSKWFIRPMKTLINIMPLRKIGCAACLRKQKQSMKLKDKRFL